MSETKSSNVIQSLQVASELLDLIASSGKTMKFNEIHEKSGMSKSNLHKYLNTLTLTGLLYRDRSSGHFTLGSKLIEYGMKAVNREDVMERVMPYMQEIHDTCKNTVLLTAWTPTGPIVVRMMNNLEGLNIGAQIGTVLPLNSAAGKVYAAFSDEHVVENWRSKEWDQLSEGQRQELTLELEEVRKHAIAFAQGPLVSSISSIAIPIFNFASQLMGVVVVVGFSDSIARKLDALMSQYLIKVRNEISEAFGYKLTRPVN